MIAAPAIEHVEPWFPSNASNRQWAVLSARAPQLSATMRRYLLQLTMFLAPRSVEMADATLRQLARWLTTETDVVIVNQVTRSHVEDYKVWLAGQGRPGRGRHAGEEHAAPPRMIPDEFDEETEAVLIARAEVGKATV